MTESQKIAEAKKETDRVVNQMKYTDSDLRRILRIKIGELIDKCLNYSNLGKDFQFNTDPKLEKYVNEKLIEIQKELFNIIYLRCVNVETLAYGSNKRDNDNKLLIAFLSSKIADKTLEMRIEQYVSQLRSEVEAFIAIGIHKRFNRDKILAEYLTNLNKPYKASIMIEAFKENGFKAERIVSKGISYGRGKYIASFNNLKRLEQTTIFQAYHHIKQNIWNSDKNYLGWMTFRNSGYFCPDFCEPQVGVFHPKTELYQGWHDGCVCLCIPIYKSDIV